MGTALTVNTSITKNDSYSIYYKASDCTNEPPSEVAALQSCGVSIEMYILISNPSMNHQVM